MPPITKSFPLILPLLFCSTICGSLTGAEKPSDSVVLPNALQTEQAEWRFTTTEPAEGWERPGFDDRSWGTGKAGFGAGKVAQSITRTPWNTSDIWLRRRFLVDAPGDDNLGLHIHHDDDAEVYVNGEKVAAFDRDADVYAKIPIVNMLRQGENTIAVHCHQLRGPQYIDVGLVRLPLGERLYNGITLSGAWPPRYDRDPRQPMPVPYLENPPEVISIDIGRQLFVDDFLIAETTLQREFHKPEYHPGNPVLKPDRIWENKSVGWFAAPFSGGVWYDPGDQKFKMWYTGGYLAAQCLATSRDGVHWEKPALDVEPDTNIVLEPVKNGRRRIDTATFWLDQETKKPAERFKYFGTEAGNGWNMTYRTSADGIHWSEPIAQEHIRGDRSTAFYNPFRKMWVLSKRVKWDGGRAREYSEHADPAELINRNTETVSWCAGEDLDPHHEDPKYSHIKPQLYNLDAAPYESLMVGQFCIWQGPDNGDCGRDKLQKRCEILLGFSRDGFHWDRPDRERFIRCTWDEKSWRYGNVQSVNGMPLVVGDKLFFYFTGRAKPQNGYWDTEDIQAPREGWDADAATGLAILRRDGFASMGTGADEKTGTLTTRPVTFRGRRLFVNVDCPKGELRAEVLDPDGVVIAPFTKKKCETVSGNKTLAPVTWKGGDLSKLAGRPVRFRFHLGHGRFYAFWVSPDESGASNGYVNGDPGLTSATDTVGKAPGAPSSERTSSSTGFSP